MADIFICYCRRDMKKVTHWVKQLQDRGYSVWMDLQSVEGATLWAKEIVEAIDACKVLVVMLSKASIDSPNVVKEVSLASEKGKPILPLKLEAVEIPATMQYQLANIHFLELFHGDEANSLDAIARALDHHGVAAGAEAAGPAAGPSHLSGSKKKLIGIAAAAVAALVLIWVVSALVPRNGGPGPGDHAGGPVKPPPATQAVRQTTTGPVTPTLTRPVKPPVPPPPTAAPLAEAALKLAAVRLNIRWVRKGFLADTDRTFELTVSLLRRGAGSSRYILSIISPARCGRGPPVLRGTKQSLASSRRSLNFFVRLSTT